MKKLYYITTKVKNKNYCFINIKYTKTNIICTLLKIVISI